jgi:hypothetical protein
MISTVPCTEARARQCGQRLRLSDIVLLNMRGPPFEGNHKIRLRFQFRKNRAITNNPNSAGPASTALADTPCRSAQAGGSICLSRPEGRGNASPFPGFPNPRTGRPILVRRHRSWHCNMGSAAFGAKAVNTIFWLGITTPRRRANLRRLASRRPSPYRQAFAGITTAATVVRNLVGARGFEPPTPSLPD